MKRALVGGYKCSMSGCPEHTRRTLQQNISFFRFPLDPERSKLWLQACGIQKDITAKKLHNNYRVCSKHFATHMFLNDLKNRLQPHAVPSPVPNVPIKDIRLIKIEETPAETCTPLKIEPNVPNAVASCSTSNLTGVDDRNLTESLQTIIFYKKVKSDKSTQTQSRLLDSSPRKVALLKKLRAAEKREKRAKLTCEKRKMEEKNISLSDFKKLMYKFFPKPIADFMQTQTYNCDSNSHGNRYPKEMKKFCLDLYRKGPNAYRFLGTVFTLPKKRTLERLIERQRFQRLE